jgi:hypothetical protein
VALPTAPLNKFICSAIIASVIVFVGGRAGGNCLRAVCQLSALLLLL